MCWWYSPEILQWQRFESFSNSFKQSLQISYWSHRISLSRPHTGMALWQKLRRCFNAGLHWKTLTKVKSSSSTETSIFSPWTLCHKIHEKRRKAINSTTRYVHATWRKRKNSHTTNYRRTPIYGRSLDNTILPALNDIAMSQAQPTKNTKKRLQSLTWLCCNIQKRRLTLSCKQHATPRRFWCCISCGTTRKKQNSRILLFQK